LPRNPVIAKLFRCAKLADNAGYGFDKMLKWEKSTHTKVCFENSIDVALVTFKIDGMTIENIENAENVTENKEKDIIDLINKNNHISTKEIAEKLFVTRMTIHRYLEKLKSKGLIERVGADKGGYWRVN